MKLLLERSMGAAASAGASSPASRNTAGTHRMLKGTRKRSSAKGRTSPSCSACAERQARRVLYQLASGGSRINFHVISLFDLEPCSELNFQPAAGGMPFFRVCSKIAGLYESKEHQAQLLSLTQKAHK